jgi:UDP-N-acetylglucosamine:LPS N-acetylglucosamine transferase
MRNLNIVFFDAGGGHRNAADALQSALQAQSNPWAVSLLNLQELLDQIDPVHRTTGIRMQDVYNLILRRGWTRFTPQLLPVLQGLVRLNHGRVVRVLQRYWAEHPSDLVLSVIPHFNRTIAESVRKSLPASPFVTMLTDFADYPPHFWIERESEYLICGTERAKQQALAMGHSPLRVFQTSGMVMKSKFYKKPAIDRVAEWKRLGLAPDCPTGIVLFGGHGAPVMLDIAKKLSESSLKLQLIMICGHNQNLAAELKNLPDRKRIFVEGFTTQVDHYMALADFFIGKPGPGSISEALQFDLPVIVESNAKTMPQERYNAEWLTENRLGIVLPSFRGIAGAVEHLLQPSRFQELRDNARAHTNRALFQVPVILEEVFERHMPEYMPVAPMGNVDLIGRGAMFAGSH